MQIDRWYELGPAGRGRVFAQADGRRLEPPEVLGGLARILGGDPPAGLPAGPRTLSKRLREDDALAQRVWSHPMYVALVGWVQRHYPRCPDAWEEMAVYAVSRVGRVKAGQCSTADVRAGMLDTAWWVGYRGRQGERLDFPERTVEPEELVAEPLVVPMSGSAGPSDPVSPVVYLATVLGTDLPATARGLIDQAWEIAHQHYVMLAETTGLTGEALLAGAQSNVNVNPARRLSGQLPRDWPTATRKSVVHLVAGSPSEAGLLAWWATTPPGEVPSTVRRRWCGLVAVIDPRVGGLAEVDRRRLRDQARRWAPSIPEHEGIAV